ncbi:MAG: baseplate J/gp47 family protein [Bacteroidaceae bacterium]|nr:baseplate J/gp47 family protein [Bacteroidaceae bacterium]
MPQFKNIYTYENIQKLKMSVVPESLDTREGSVIWNAVAANSIEMALAFAQIAINQDNAFPDTANRAYLIRHCAMRGITPKSATSAVIHGKFLGDVVNKTPYNPPVGTRFTLQNTKLKYKVTEKISDGEWKLECETPGIEGNVVEGVLVPVEEIQALGGASVVDILEYGEGEEETEALRERYMESLKAQPFAGNKAAYKEMCSNIPNVGACKVYRAYNGEAGHVGLCILDKEMNPPNDELIQTVQNTIDPSQDGEGLGLAPIDHIVHVFPATKKTININVKIVPVYTDTQWDNIKPSVVEALNEYIEDLRRKWDTSEKLYISPSHIIAKLLSVDTVQDVDECLINGKDEKLELASHEIPEVGGVDGQIV